MSGRGRRRLSDTLTGLATLTFPRARRSDARVIRDCAREAVDARGLRVLPRESLSLAVAGVRTRAGLAVSEMRHAPWREALAVLALPLAATLLLVWTFGFISRYDHWPPGEGWVLLLGGSLVAVVGAALERGRLAAGGALLVFAVAASPYLGFGTGTDFTGTPSFYHGWGVDIGVASLLPTLLLVAAGLSLPRGGRPLRAVHTRLAAGLSPAVIAAVYLFPGPAREPTIMMHYSPNWQTRTLEGPPTIELGPPYSMPWIPESRPLLRILGIALAVAVVVTWRTARARPASALASAMVLASVAYPLVWVLVRFEPVPTPWWAYNAAYTLLLAGLPLLLALYLMRRAGRASAAAR
ncbi:MAG TPA: hypothetical protein VK506_06470 [Conexibacter sp.]|nr:hypothetical protein [Conexibacter sp.]